MHRLLFQNLLRGPVTEAVTTNMREARERTYEATPHPK